MDNIQFGRFVAQLRKEQNLTQKELAERLHVTDKAVSKWETGKGFPDLKLLDPLAQVLNVSLVELLQGERTPSPTLTKEEAGQAAVQAMEQSQKNTARRYLRLFQVVLWIGATLCLISLILIPPLTFWGNLLWLDLFRSQGLGVIGSADGPTVILTAGGPLIPYEAQTVLIVLALLTCAVMAVRVRRLERRLK